MRRQKAVNLRSFTLLLVLKLYRNKKVITGLAALFVLLSGAAFASASPKKFAQGFSYKTKLSRDLDGDHIPETATIRQHGSFYQVSIHFTTGRPKLRLRTYVTDDLAGLTVEIADVDHDTRADLVINSATSVWPVAIWLNHGKDFQRVSKLSYEHFNNHSGPGLDQKKRSQHNPVGNLFSDPLPQAETGDSFNPGINLKNTLSSKADPLPFEFTLTQAAPRGPPTETHI
jgi:hypothetical protein